MIFRCLQGLALALLLLVSPLAPAASVCDLDGAQDPGLQQELKAVLQREGLAAATDRGDLAVSLLVLSDPDRPMLAQINGDHMIYAASLPKIAILLGAAVALDEGQLRLDPVLEQDIHDMIRYSCNECSNRVLDRVGAEQLLDILQAPQFGFYDPEHGGGLWLGKPYGPAPAYHRDPLANLSHAATTFQVARFYCGLRQGELVSPEQTRLMLDAMSEPGIRHKFVKGLSGHDDLRLYRKSGTWRDFHADSALVETGEQAYVMVGLAHSKRGSRWLERLAEPLHEIATAVRRTQVDGGKTRLKAVNTSNSTRADTRKRLPREASR
jgi:beta-lactamase class A